MNKFEFEKINIYCDESCHLRNKDSDVMVVGALWIYKKNIDGFKKEIRKIKEKYNLYSGHEIKWTKVSKSKLPMYEELIDLFFSKRIVGYRAIVIKDKKGLKFSSVSKYNDWYYAMCYNLLEKMIDWGATYRIFLDIKDQQSAKKIRTLKSFLHNGKWDFDHILIEKIEAVSSDNNDLLQIVDLINGALCFYNRGLYDAPNSSNTKKQIVDFLLKHRKNLTCTTTLKEKKFNLFFWRHK